MEVQLPLLKSISKIFLVSVAFSVILVQFLASYNLWPSIFEFHNYNTHIFFSLRLLELVISLEHPIILGYICACL